MLRANHTAAAVAFPAMESPQDVSRRFRERAIELLVMAEKVGIPSAASDLRELAARWIEMAEREEARATPRVSA
jgi:hypothetical protein